MLMSLFRPWKPRIHKQALQAGQVVPTSDVELHVMYFDLEKGKR